MKHTKKNIALALTIGLTAMNLGFADSLIADYSAIKPISCTTSGCNTAKDHDDMNACDNCNSLTSENKRDMKQIYTYPESVYGTNNKVGNNHHNSVATSYNDAFLRESKGVPLAEKGSNITGAAANMPVVGTNNIDELNTGLDFGSPRIKIETPSSQQILMRSFKPVYHDNMTGAAAPLRSFFPDVNNSFWASEQINRLANEDIAQGYPSGLFKPNSQISRAEMASFLVLGMNMDESVSSAQAAGYKDVPQSHWAYKIINAAKENNLMGGTNGMFKPDGNISRMEAMSLLAKKIDSNMSDAKANEILSNYKNGSNVPYWAKKDVAKVIEANGLEDMPNKDKIFTSGNATRAEVASMLDNIRISLGYSDKNAPIASSDVEKSYVPTEEVVTVPTLKLSFKDIVSARSATVGEQFAATTLEEVVIDGVTYEAGSTVRGKVSEVIRPSKNDDGAIKLSFETIEKKGSKSDLPTQVLAVQVNNIKQPGFGIRMVQMPFTLLGTVIGTAGRTVGGAAISVANAAEQTLNGIGMAGGELAGANFKASGRSLQDVGKTIVKAPIDLTRTAVLGTVDLFKTSGDEVAYLVDYNGRKISTLKPKQEVTISFACYK